MSKVQYCLILKIIDFSFGMKARDARKIKEIVILFRISWNI
jgi:hypothetical protein